MKRFYTKIMLFAVAICLGLVNTQAQAPGGVSTGLQLWLPAENYTGGTSWTDASGNGRNAAKTGNAITNSTLFNYNRVTKGYTSANYFSIPHNTALDANNGAIAVFAVGGGASIATYNVFAGKTNASSWDNGWILTTSSPATDAGFTTGDWSGVGTTNVAKQPGFSTTVPYIISGFGNGAATNIVSVSNNGNTETTNTSTKTTSATRLTIGYDGYTYNNLGAVGEVIMYNTALSSTDKLRVQSYLAVKYGMTLNTTASPNYVNSAGTIIWTGSSHSGYQNNIFGIARDNTSLLNQKQSKSTTDGSITAYVDSLQTTNSANTGTLTDLDAILFGDNNLSGNTVYSHTTGTSFANGTIAASISNRSTKIWNVQVTNAGVSGGTYTLNIATTGYVKANYVLVSNGIAFTPASTRFYAVTGGSATGVVVNNGDYITIGSFQPAPGGVSNTNVAWFAADLSGNTIGSAATQWQDLSPSPYTLQAAGTVTLNAGDAAHNFNPYFSGFSGANYFRTYAVADVPSQTNGFTKIAKGYSVPPAGLDAGQFSVFSAARPTSTGGGSITGIDNDVSYAAEPGFGLTASLQPRMFGFSASIISNTAGTLTLNKTSVLSYLPKYISSVNSFVANIDGVASGTTMSTSTATAGSNLQIGLDAYTMSYFRGDIQEVIWHKSILSAAEVNKVETYLAIKYGTTITAGTATNYLNSAGTTVWTGDAAYQRNMAGISRDDVSNLNQKQSNSVNPNTNGQVVIGLGNIAATNIANTNSFSNDATALIWGDNGNTTAMTNTVGSYTEFTYNGYTNNRRMTRIWKVQNTGLTQLVNIQFPTASVGTTTLTGEGGCAKYVIIFSKDGSFGNGDDSTSLLTVSGGNYIANRKFPQGVSYFTFAKLNEVSPGNVYLPTTDATMTVTDPCLKGGWKYYYFDAAKTQKAFAINWNGNTEPGGINGVLTYSTDAYSVTANGYTCNIMGRLTEVLPSGGNFTTNGGVKVRIFLDSTELTNSLVSGALSQRWFKYPGNASATQAANNGQTITGATFLTPATKGEEDGIDFVEFNGIQSFSTFGFASNTGMFPLPVKLSSFEANKKGNTADLKWVTASEQNNRGFDIERSTDGRTWTKIGFVASGSVNGNSSTALQYNFTDNNPVSDQNFYRLKQIDFDGNYDYSDARNLLFSIAGSITIYPNPGNKYVNINGLQGNERIYLYDATSKLVKQQNSNGTQLTMNLENLSEGVYYIRIVTLNGTITSHKIIKTGK